MNINKSNQLEYKGKFKIIATTLYGLEDLLEQELHELGAENIQVGRRMISFAGDKKMLYNANFRLRTAMRVLKPILECWVNSEDIFSRKMLSIDWTTLIPAGKTFKITSVVNSDIFKHSLYITHLTKDAIVQSFQRKGKERPTVSKDNADISILVHISQSSCTVSLDSSGESLHKRGYRAEQTAAPISEVLAAAIILRSGWRGQTNFVDPFCGSGTLLIEAAMIALNIPPGIYREHFAFENWEDFDKELLQDIYNDESSERTFNFMCYGSDINERAIEIARRNIRSAGLNKYINLKVQDFAKSSEEDAPQPGIIATNPPYGERISSSDLHGLYEMIGERLKHNYTGYDAWILSHHEECFAKIGLRPSAKIKLLNGSLPCQLRHYQLFKGKRAEKAKK